MVSIGLPPPAMSWDSFSEEYDTKTQQMSATFLKALLRTYHTSPPP